MHQQTIKKQVNKVITEMLLEEKERFKRKLENLRTED